MNPHLSAIELNDELLAAALDRRHVARGLADLNDRQAIREASQRHLEHLKNL